MTGTDHANDLEHREETTIGAGNRWLYAILGSVFVVLALLAFAMPVAATFAANLGLGGLLIFAGAAEIAGSFRRKEGWSGFAFGVVALIAGALAIIFPLAGIFSFTAVITAYFLIGGLARLFHGLRRRPQRLWGLVVASGVVSLGLGVFLIVALPEAAFVTLGILLAVDFAFFGAALITAAMFGHRPPGAIPPDRLVTDK